MAEKAATFPVAAAHATSANVSSCFANKAPAMRYAVAVLGDIGETLALLPLLKRLAQEGWSELAVIAISKESVPVVERFVKINGPNDGSWMVKIWTPETLGFDDSYTFVYGQAAQEFTDEQLLKIQSCIGKPRLL